MVIVGRKFARLLTAVVLTGSLFLLTGAACSGRAVKPSGEEIAKWARSWKNEVDRNRELPNRFLLPKPPSLDYLSLVPETERVKQSIRNVSGEEALDPGYVQGVFCYWFAWYMETGTAVPTDQDFFAEHLIVDGLHQILQPRSIQLQNAIESFRQVIEQAQNEDTTGAQTAVAAVCALPL